MSDEPSPRPWRVGENSLGWRSCIEDANGKQIVSCWGGDGVNCTEPAQSDAALIVSAVNERNRLREIVRRIETEMGRCHRRDGGISQELMDTVYEARAAIGEDKK